MTLERLNKIIAASTNHSRRKADELISAGKVIVNGQKVTELGLRFDSTKIQVSVAGKPLKLGGQKVYLLIHKPKDVMVTANDPQKRRTIYDLIPKKYHYLKPIGRLDYASEGLIVLTNDGELNQQLANPQNKFLKVYEVKIKPKPKDFQLKKMAHGIMLDGQKTMPAEITVLRHTQACTWVRFEIKEGRNRQIRRMCENVGLFVQTLIRVQMGPFYLGKLPKGKWLIRYQIDENNN